jgi:hypothetical protein
LAAKKKAARRVGPRTARKQAVKRASPKPSGKESTGVVYSDVLHEVLAKRLGRL